MPKTVLRFFWEIIKPYKKWYFLMFLGPLSCGLQPLLYNYSLRNFINFLTSPNVENYGFMNPIIGFILCEFYLQISWRIHNYATWQFVPSLYQDITDKIFNYVTHHSYDFFQNNLSGTIISKMRGISDTMYSLNSAIEGDIMQSILKLFFLAIGLCCTSYQIFIMIIIFVTIKILLSIYFLKKLGKIEENCQNDWHYLFGLIADNITNIFNLFAFATRDRERKKIWNYYENVHTPLRRSWHRYDFWTSIITSSIDVVFMIFFCFYLLHLKEINKINVGDIAFIIISVNTFLDNLWKSINGVKDFLQKYAKAKAAYSIIATPQEIIDPIDAKKIKISKGAIEFKNVSFHYDKKNSVFENLNICIKPGEKIGIIGNSGVGKSTLISLLMKNFKSVSGDILIDGDSIYRCSSDSLRSQISYIPQEVVLFHRSIGENIGYAKENSTPSEIIQAAENASIHQYIMSLPKQYDTLVGERGVKLSGGQRQRVAIARAFLKNSLILILDEATSALDSITEKEVQAALWNLMKSKTCIVIAHRLSTLVDMDRILVFDKGKVVQDGNHEKLSMQDGIYKDLWDTQVKGFIIEN